MYFHTDSVGPDENALRTAFKKCGEIAQKKGYSKLGLAVPAKTNLYGMLSDLLGEDVINIFQRDNVLDLNGITIHLITRRVKPKNFSGPVLAVHTALDQTKEIAKAAYCKELIYVPWTDEEGPEFEKHFKSVAIYRQR